MKSAFEKYLEAQRSRLDVESPDDALIWEGINRGLQQRKKRRDGFFWKAAAVLIFLASATYVLYNEMYRPRQNIYNISLSDIDPSYSQRVETYQAAINQKMQEVEELETPGTTDMKAYFEEMRQLDRMFREYQEDYRMLGRNERLIRAMLDYYDKKVRILDRMLMEIQKQKDNEKRKKHTRI